MAAKGSARATTGISGRAVGVVNLRSWQPGTSGNPRGRSKRDAEIAELARAHTAEALQTLANIMGDEAAPPSARVSAASAILDRGWGRPPQSLDVEHKLSLGEEFEAFVRSLGRGDARLIEVTDAGDGKDSGRL